MKLPNIKYKLILFILLLSLASSILLSFVPLSILCTPLEGCNAVQTSSYAQTFGIHNSDIGIAIFALMILVTISYIRKPTKQKKNLIRLGIFGGTFISLYFIYLQKFVIHAWCKYCLVVDIGMLIAFVIINIPDKKEKSEEIKLDIKPKNVTRNS
jgi:uncharacterized membrane protein